MKIEIKHWMTGRLLFEGDFSSLADAVTAAVKNKAYLRGADLRGAYLRGADLTGADLTGADLRDADLTGADLTRADLTGADLTGADLTRADLTGADLRGAYLRGADLTGANLTGADLTGANLRGADLTDANLTGLPPIPLVKNIDSKILKAVKVEGALDMSTWHACGTTHCRGGWAIMLAGKAGKKLEEATSPELAAILIYQKARPNIPIPDFYASNAEAMADLERCAAAEKHPATKEGKA